MIGNCDNCDRVNVPVSNGQFCGCDTTQCYVCQHDEPDPYGELEEIVSEAMQEPADTAELQIERRADFIIRELDEFCAMATNRETVDLIAREVIAFGQMQTRVQLILSFLEARKPNKFRVISNG